MTYRVSTKPNGEKRWWEAGEEIPADHTNIRPASTEEANAVARVLELDANDSLIDTPEGDHAADRVRDLLDA
jgi:hypothetical protein